MVTDRVAPFDRAVLFRASDGRQRLALAAQVGITGPDPESRTAWIHVAPMGEWAGHSEGQFSLTADDFACVQRVAAGKSTPVSVDYEHASIRPNGGPTPAAGFVQATEVRPDGLWAQVEFTKRAADMIRAGEYRFCSGVFDFSSVDPVSGEPIPCVLDSIALTNRPFLDGQQPISLTRRASLSNGAKTMTIDPADLLRVLKAIGKDITPEQAKSAVDMIAGGGAPSAAASAPEPDGDEAGAAEMSAPPPPPVDAPAAPLADDPPPAPDASMAAPPPNPDAAADAGVDDSAMDAAQQHLAEATGLSLDQLAAALVANMDAVVAAISGGAVDASAAALSKDVNAVAFAALRAQNVALAKELTGYRAKEAREAESKRVAEVEGWVAAGKAPPAQKAGLLSLTKNPAAFAALSKAMEAIPANPLLKPHATAMTPPPAEGERLTETTVERLPKDHPRVVELTKALRAMGARPELVEAEVKKLTGA